MKWCGQSGRRECRRPRQKGVGGDAISAWARRLKKIATRFLWSARPRWGWVRLAKLCYRYLQTTLDLVGIYRWWIQCAGCKNLIQELFTILPPQISTRMCELFLCIYFQILISSLAILWICYKLLTWYILARQKRGVSNCKLSKLIHGLTNCKSTAKSFSKLKIAPCQGSICDSAFRVFPLGSQTAIISKMKRADRWMIY